MSMENDQQILLFVKKIIISFNMFNISFLFNINIHRDFI